MTKINNTNTTNEQLLMEKFKKAKKSLHRIADALSHERGGLDMRGKTFVFALNDGITTGGEDPFQRYINRNSFQVTGHVNIKPSGEIDAYAYRAFHMIEQIVDWNGKTAMYETECPHYERAILIIPSLSTLDFFIDQIPTLIKGLEDGSLEIHLVYDNQVCAKYKANFGLFTSMLMETFHYLRLQREWKRRMFDLALKDPNKLFSPYGNLPNDSTIIFRKGE